MERDKPRFNTADGMKRSVGEKLMAYGILRSSSLIYRVSAAPISPVFFPSFDFKPTGRWSNPNSSDIILGQ